MTTSVGEVDLGDATIATRTWGEGRPELVLLHDGLGSIEQWRSVPAMLAASIGRTVLAYDRPGHGASTPIPSGPWPTGWLEMQAELLGRLLVELEVDRPLLIGHSDGGSIALLHATVADVEGVVTLAAHSYVEPRCVEAIERMAAEPAAIVAGLARYHAAPTALFEAWSGVWTSAGFQAWDIRPDLGAIEAPVLVVQGSDDEYATRGHVDDTVAAVGHDRADGHVFEGVGHLLHHEAPDRIVELISGFARRVRRRRRG